jgi:putative salt-induced outer membrane protein YdiY
MISLVALAAWIAARDAAPIASLPQPEAVYGPVVPATLEDPPPPDLGWSGSITVGGLVTTGNSETRQGNASADAEYRREKDRWSFGFLWLYSDNRNTPTNTWELTDRKTSGKAKYDYFFTKKTYGLVNALCESDWQANIDLRSTLGVGIGHQFVETEKTKFGAEIGVAEVIEDRDATFLPPNTESVTEGQSGRVATKLGWDPTERFGLAHSLECYVSFEDASDVFGRSDLALKVTLTENMIAQAQWVFDYDNTPALGKERVDNRYLLTVGWKF